MEKRKESKRQPNLKFGNNSRITGLLASSKFAFFLFMAAALLAIPAWRGWESLLQLRTTENHIRDLISLEGSFAHRDDSLSMSLKMAAETADPNWIKRYEEIGKRAKPVIAESWNISDSNTAGTDAVLANHADDIISEIEQKAIELINQGNNKYAGTLLASGEYEGQRDEYKRGMKAFVINIRKSLEERYDNFWKEIQIAIAAIFVVVPIIVILWLAANKAGRLICERSRRKRDKGTFGKEWQETFNAITDGVCIINTKGCKIQQCNRAMTRLMNKPYSEIIGQNCCELIHGSCEPVKKCPFMRMLNTNRSESTEFKLGDKWVNIKVEPLLDKNKKLVGAVHILSDITQQKVSSKVVRESESKFRLAFENAQDAIVWIDGSSGIITNCNKASETLLVKRKKEIVGQLHTTLYPEDKKEIYQNLLFGPDRGLNGSIEAEITTRSGQIRTVTISTSTMYVDGSEIVQGIIRDITESKKAIEEVKNLARFPSEDPNPVLRISSDCKILYANDASWPVLETWQTEKDQCLPEAWRGRMKEVYDSGNSATFELNCDDGHIFFITLQPIAGAGYINAYGLDITNRKKAEKEKMELELQFSQKQKMEAIGTLAGGIAHDFNNILSALQGYAELSLDDLPQDSPVRDNLEQILVCSSRATKLVKQILTFSRKDDQEREKEPVKVSDIIKEVLDMMRSSLPKTIKICRRINAVSGTILADPTKIHQVLVNLCTNASHAMGQAGGILEVGLADVGFESQTRIGDEHIEKGPYVKLSVRDTGCGMDKETLARIFEPFFTTKKVNEGTGLGLSVVHGIVKSHGGAIAVSSTPGEGTTFDIYFPRIESGQDTESQSQEPVKKEQKVILLVDDEEMMVDVTGQILERLGFSVVAKTSSIDALEEFQEKPDEFDLVITDQVMPNMTGTELAQKLIFIRPDIPIILCSGFPENVSQEEIGRIGIKKFIAKPLGKQEIAEAVQAVLEKKETAACHIFP